VYVFVVVVDVVVAAELAVLAVKGTAVINDDDEADRFKLLLFDVCVVFSIIICLLFINGDRIVGV
jgi:hypothetical protein